MTKPPSILDASLSQARRALSRVGLAGTPPPSTFVPRTIWAVGVPTAVQVALKAGMPELVFRFLPADDPLADRRARIIASERPCIAVSGDIEPVDLDSFVADTGVAVARLSPVPLMAQQVHFSWALAPYGFTLELPGGKRGSAAIPRPEAQRLLALFVASGCSEANFGRQEALAYQPSRAAVLIVGDPPERIAPRLPARFAAYRTMLAEARAQHPDREIVFVTNGDNDLPPDVLADLRRYADMVLYAPYDTAMLPHYEAVFVHRSWAAFDALVRGRRATVYGDSPLAGVAPEADVLADLFAERYLQRTCYVDPATRQAIDLPLALELIANRRPSTPGPRATAVPAATLGDGQVQAEESGPQDAGFNRDRIIPSRTDAPDPATVRGSLRLPDWVTPESALPPAGDKPMLYLRSDMASAPFELLALASGWQVLEIDVDHHRARSPARVDDVARRQAELFGRLMRHRIDRHDASHAVLTDLASPATRAFARACEREGLTRIYVPPAPFGPAAGWGDLPPLAMATTLVDVALAWDESHLIELRAAGFPAGRILPVTLVRSAPTPARDRLILVDLTLPWPAFDGEMPDTADEFVTMLLGVAGAFDHRIRFYFGREVAAIVSDQTLNQIMLSDHGSYEVEDTEETPLYGELRTASLLITDRPRPFNRARIGGIAAMTVHHGDGPERATARMRAAVSAWFDTKPDLPSASPIAAAPPAATVLADLIDGEIEFAPLGSPKAIAMGGERLPINLATSSVTPEVLEQTERYELAMLGVRHWTRATATTPLEDLADVDLFLQWGVRRNDTISTINAYRRRLDRDLLILEDGFIRSIAIGLAGSPTLSLIMDDMTAFYDATQPSRLETILASEFSPSKAELSRARAAIRLIAEQKVSKYNFAPYVEMQLGRPDRRKVLVVDQREGDQSILSGLASADSFQRMAEAALALTPDCDVIVKTHPDANIGGRSSAIGAAMLETMRANPAVTIVTEDVNPYALLDIVDEVFVVTSGMGLEALMAGCTITCFGVPFYAGWGVTTDRGAVPARRTGTRTLEEIFHVFYIMLSRYFDPEQQRVCEVEDLVRHIAAVRPWTMPPVKPRNRRAAPAGAPAATPAAPAKPSRIPVLPTGATIWLLGADKSERPAFQRLLKGWEVRTTAENATLEQVSGPIRQSSQPVVIACAPDMPGLRAFGSQWSIPVLTLDDLAIPLPKALAHYRKPGGTTA